MEKVLSNLSSETCMVYLDYIIVIAPDFSQHLNNLEEVFKRLKNSNLKINPKKCKLLQKDVTYLGHVISEEGINSDPEKIAAVIDWPIPKNIRNVRSFLGICVIIGNWYKSFQ